MLIYDMFVSMVMSSTHITDAEIADYDNRVIAMGTLVEKMLEFEPKLGTDLFYQALIDVVYQSKAKNEEFKWSAHLLMCAIKELMTHKDNEHGFVGKDYLWEKVSKAMKEVDMPIKEA